MTGASTSGERPSSADVTGFGTRTGLLGPAEPPLIVTISLLIVSMVASAFALHYTRPVMVPFVLAIFITYLVSPVVDFLRVRWRFPKPGAVAAALVVAAALLFVLALLIITSTAGLIDNIGIYQARITSLVGRATGFLDRFNVDLGQDALVAAVRDLPFLVWIQRWAGTAAVLVANGALVLIFVVYLLSGRHPNQFRSGIYAEIDSKVRSYVLIKVATSATTGLLTGLILSLFGLDLALVFGVIAFLLNFIPSVGSVIATLLPLPVALIQFDSGVIIALTILLPGVVQFTIGNVVEPLVMGEGLDLHPVVILMALVFWGLMWGVVGMLLAAPITAVFRIVFARIEITRPLAELLAGRLPVGVGLHTEELRVSASAE